MAHDIHRRRLLQAAIGTLALGPQASVRAQSRGELLLGQSAVLSGPLGKAITALNQGMQLAFDQANAAGGINGQALKLVSLDDELKPEKAVANYKTLIGQRVSAFIGCVGSGTTAAAAGVLRESGLPSFGGYAVGDGAREKARGAAYFVRATYGREAEVLVQHLLTLGIDRIAVAHLANPGGDEVLHAVTRLLEAKQVKLRGAGAVANDGANAGEVARNLAALDAQAIIMFLSAPLAAAVMDAVLQTGHRPNFYGMSIVAGDGVAGIIGAKARGLVVAQAVPYPWSEVDPTAQDYRRLCTAKQASPNYIGFEGYLNAMLFIGILRRSGDLSAQRIHAAIRATRLRLAGMNIDFGDNDLSGSRFVELVQVTEGGHFVR
jgi:ABC-type branched-subunit amino acid transport system substrate-binding protein